MSENTKWISAILIGLTIFGVGFDLHSGTIVWPGLGLVIISFMKYISIQEGKNDK